MPRTQRIPAVWLVLGSIFSVQLGAAIAKGLFDVVSPTAMVWFRLVTSAVVLMLVARPRLSGHTRADAAVALAFGACLVTMNLAFYHSMAYIPVGIAVTIEFLGPLTLAVLGSRRIGDLLWVGLAAVGVALLGFSRTGLNLPGVLYALLAAVAWAGYILLSTHTGRRWPGISGLAIASLFGAAVLAPVAINGDGTRLLQPAVLLVGAAVGVLSSVLPYSLELIALRRIPPRVFGILMSLEPAVAALAALLVLRELLQPVQWLAMACVVAASVGAARTSRG